MAKITIDTNGLQKSIDKALTDAHRELDKALPQAVNVGIARTETEGDPAIAADLHIPHRVADEATERRPAQAEPTASLTAYDRKAPYFRWITQADEKVCKVCGPLHGKIFKYGEIEHPAHPNCRCIAEPLSVAAAMLRLAPALLRKAMPDAVRHAVLAFVRRVKKLTGVPMATNTIVLPKVGDEETFLNSEFILATQLYTGGETRTTSRLLIYINGMETVTVEASPTVSSKYLEDLNQHIINSINNRNPPEAYPEEPPPTEGTDAPTRRGPVPPLRRS